MLLAEGNEDLGCDLRTADQRHWNPVRDQPPDVFWLGDYPL
jgi:hypothetical protein